MQNLQSIGMYVAMYPKYVTSESRYSFRTCIYGCFRHVKQSEISI